MIYVISDTHVPERTSKLPQKFLDKIKPHDTIFHAGDFVCWETFKELESLATLHAVSGNMDHLRIKDCLEKKKLVSLQGKRIGSLHSLRVGSFHSLQVGSLHSLQVGSLRSLQVGIYHGSGSPFGLGERVYQEFEEKPDVIIFGHSHIPYNKKKENTLLFNPGSLSGNSTSPSGRAFRTSPFATYGVLTIEGGDVWGEIFEIEKLAG